MSDLHGRKFLVTGGSRGIGKVIAQSLLAAGAIVCISGTNVRTLEEVSNGLMGVLPCDLHNVNEAEALVDKAHEFMSGLDGLICNAGITRDGLLARMSMEQWNEVLQVNLTSTFILNRNACKLMARYRWGRIINISSVVASTGNPGQINYVAAKAGIEAMTKVVAKEYATRNITANCIAPGFIDTDMTANLTAEQKNQILANIPMRSMGKPENIAAAVMYLVSYYAGYMTGQTLHINGGLFV